MGDSDHDQDHAQPIDSSTDCDGAGRQACRSAPSCQTSHREDTTRIIAVRRFSTNSTQWLPGDRPHRPPTRVGSINVQPTLSSPAAQEAILANPVVIVGYDPSWPDTFAQLRDRVAAALGPLAVAIEHIGSTAVPGLAAKPIIDLDVVIANRANLPAVMRRLRPLGYHHEGDLGVPGREAFTTPAGAPPHHLYVCVVGTPALNRHLTFRDALRAHPAAADAYGDLKRTLAARLSHDRVAYTEAKTGFVERALAEAAPA
jgi:GrpB-like predicted nucleotidyltransferase (UPF0157 family)